MKWIDCNGSFHNEVVVHIMDIAYILSGALGLPLSLRGSTVPTLLLLLACNLLNLLVADIAAE